MLLCYVMLYYVYGYIYIYMATPPTLPAEQLRKKFGVIILCFAPCVLVYSTADAVADHSNACIIDCA